MRVFGLERGFQRCSWLGIALLSPRAQQRARLLQGLEALLRRGVGAREAAEILGVSKATLYRWRRRLMRQGPSALEPGSRRPHHLRRPQWPAPLVARVLALRKAYPAWGKAKIVVLLRREGFAASESTVGRILGELCRRHHLPTAPQLRKRTRHARTMKRFHAQRLPKGLRPSLPGEILQLDSLHLHLLPDVPCKQFTAYCPVSHWTVGAVYSSASSQRAVDFLDKVLRDCPFTVRALQVDGGSEFKKLFEARCQQLNIPLYVLPPKSPKLNGAVERANEAWRYEFYAAYPLPHSLKLLQPLVQRFQHLYNHTRPHQALHGLTPQQYLQAHHPLLLQSHMS
jgi:putative transposase